jgi:hypothetical protein
VTSTPTYGFRISGTPEAGPMTQAMQAGNIKGIQDLLKERFPSLQFEAMDAGLEEVDKPAETTPAPAPVTDVTGETAKEQTTASLYGDYMAGLPGGVRELVTTDYKGVRGGRVGAGNYTTASMIPGAQVQTPSVPSTPSPTPSAGGGTTTTYNAPVIGGNWQQYYGDYYSGDVNYGTIGGGETATPATPTATPATPTRGMQPAWATGTKNLEKTVGKASGGLVPSTVNQGAYVQPSSPEASAGAFGALQRVQERQAAQPGNTGVLAAASGGSTAQGKGTLSLTEATAVLAAKGNNAKAAQSALNAAERGRIELTNAARNALEKAAKK